MFENITSYLYLIIVIPFVVVVLGWLGFQVPASVAQPRMKVGSGLGIPKKLDQKKLPAIVRQWLQSNHGDGGVCPGDLVAWGRGKIVGRQLPIVGPLWMPLRWYLYLQPGRGFTWKAEILWFKWVFVKGGDAYRDGKGVFAWGRSDLQSDEITRSEFELLWGYTLFFAPSILLQVESIRVEERTKPEPVRVIIPEEEGRELELTLNFDPETGQVASLDMMRTTRTAGKYLPYRIKFSNYCQFESGFILPTALETSWQEETNLKLEVAAVNYHHRLLE